MQRLCRPAQTFRQLINQNSFGRSLAYKSSRRQVKAWPRLAVQRQDSFDNLDTAVQIAHQNEKSAYRSALEQSDLAGAYQIYIEQRDVPILSGAEITSLIQLICADALLRKINRVEQLQSLKDVFWTVIEDVKEQRVPGQAILWVHALDALITWEAYDEARELWAYLKTLPNRSSLDKGDAYCIDSRVYGSAVKLYTVLGDMEAVQALYSEAMVDRQLKSSLILDQAMVAAKFQAGEIGAAYKAMDKAIREHRRALRPAFFNAMMALALDAHALGVATEIFMKACNVHMPPGQSQVTRLLSALGRSQKDSLSSVMTVFRHYRNLEGGKVPIEHLNTVISAIFASAGEADGLSTSEALTRVHQLLRDMQDLNVVPSTPTVNILLAGYIELGQHQLLEDLMSSADLNVISFRTMLKALSRKPDLHDMQTVHELWAAFEEHRNISGTIFELRDFQMVIRAAFRASAEQALSWIPDLLSKYSDQLDSATVSTLQDEFKQHQTGRFVFKQITNPKKTPTARSMKWLTQ